MGFKTEDILKKCERKIFFRGKSLYASKKVMDFEVEETKEATLLESNVKGNIKDAYHVTMELDLKNSEEKIKDYTCECEDYRTNHRLCKHCAALAFAYVNLQLERKINAMKPLVKPKQEADAQVFYDSGNQQKTSVLMQKVLMQYSNQDMGRWTDPDYGKIGIEFELVSNKRMHKLEIFIKVGNQKKYIVKGMGEFLENVAAGRKFSYGKFLSFYHSQNAFEKESRPLLNLLMECGKSQGMVDGADYVMRAYENVKEMTLSPYYTQKLCNMYAGCWVKLDKKRIQILDDNPRLTLKIIKTNGGVTLKLEEFSFYNGASRDVVQTDDGLYLVSKEYQTRVMPFLKLVQSENRAEFGKYVPKRNTLFLAEEDYMAFYVHLFAPLQQYFQIEEIGDVSFAEFKVEECKLRFYLQQDEKERITCRTECVYGVMRYDISDYHENAKRYRDMEREMEALDVLERYFEIVIDETGKCEYVIDSQEGLYALIKEGLLALEKLGTVMVPQQMKKIQIQEANQVTAGVRIAGDLLEVDVQIDEMDQSQMKKILTAYQQKKKYVRLKTGDFFMLNEKMDILNEIRTGMGIPLDKLAEGGVQVPKYRAFFLNDMMQQEKYIQQVHSSDDFREMVEQLGQIENKKFRVPKGIKTELRSYQRKGYEWLCRLSTYGFGGILADDMGLGKTLQVICWLSREKKKSLVVCPASLVYNWENEIHKFAPDMKCMVVLGSQEERKHLLEVIEDEMIVVTSYDLLKRDKELYEKIFFENMIIDEAQFIKNSNTQVAKTVKSIHAKCRFALTGTPIENRLSDLWSIFDFVMPGFLFTYPRFKTEIEIPIVHDENAKIMEKLKKMISPFVLRRKKQDVLSDLPDKLEEVVYATMTEKQKELYYARYLRLKQEITDKTETQFGKEKFQILSELTRLRQICCEPGLCYEGYTGGSGKVDLFLERVQGAVEGGSKILVFSQFATMLVMLQEQLEKQKITTMLLTGKNTKEERQQMVNRFQNGEVEVFLISLKAGGTGLNLTAADVVIHFDPWWNVAVQNQATDRAHRFGQKHVVTVIQIVTKNSIEERIIELQEKKKQLVEDVISGENISNSSISKEEIMELLMGF